MKNIFTLPKSPSQNIFHFGKVKSLHTFAKRMTIHQHHEIYSLAIHTMITQPSCNLLTREILWHSVFLQLQRDWLTFTYTIHFVCKQVIIQLSCNLLTRGIPYISHAYSDHTTLLQLQESWLTFTYILTYTTWSYNSLVTSRTLLTPRKYHNFTCIQCAYNSLTVATSFAKKLLTSWNTIHFVNHHTNHLTVTRQLINIHQHSVHTSSVATLLVEYNSLATC